MDAAPPRRAGALRAFYGAVRCRSERSGPEVPSAKRREAGRLLEAGRSEATIKAFQYAPPAASCITAAYSHTPPKKALDNPRPGQVSLTAPEAQASREEPRINHHHNQKGKMT